MRGEELVYTAFAMPILIQHNTWEVMSWEVWDLLHTQSLLITFLPAHTQAEPSPKSISGMPSRERERLSAVS